MSEHPWTAGGTGKLIGDGGRCSYTRLKKHIGDCRYYVYPANLNSNLDRKLRRMRCGEAEWALCATCNGEGMYAREEVADVT